MFFGGNLNDFLELLSWGALANFGPLRFSLEPQRRQCFVYFFGIFLELLCRGLVALWECTIVVGMSYGVAPVGIVQMLAAN